MRSLLIALCVLSACRGARTQVDDVTPALESLVGERYSAWEAETSDVLSAARWWERFEDPVLDRLVESVLAGNLDLRRAAATVREADAVARAATGARGAAAFATLDASRNLATDPSGARTYSNLFSPAVSVSWQADLFGRLRATERARVAELLATAGERRALAHTLVAEVVRRRVDLSTIARRLELAGEIVASRASTLETVERRYRGGVAPTSAVDVHLARENLASVRARLPALQRELDQAYLGLDVLLGRTPVIGARPASLSAPLPLAPPPPVGVPAGLLDRRPDLFAARQRVEASVARVDVSLAALYPDLALSGVIGWGDDELSDVFSPEAFFAGVVASLTAPLFTSGRLQAEVDAAQARAESIAAGYAQDVLQAVREVNEALVAERGLRAELEERTRQRDEARLAEDLARERYRRGLESLLIVLDAERRRASADDQVQLLQAAVWNARIDLHLALGGDWSLDEDAR